MGVSQFGRDNASKKARMSNADSQLAVRSHRIAESKEMVVQRSESFCERMAELQKIAQTSSSSIRSPPPSIGLKLHEEDVVNMASRRIVVRDTVERNIVRIHVLRSGLCFDQITLDWHVEKNVEETDLGCFQNQSGVVRFRQGAWETSIDLEFDRSKCWAPVRECFVVLAPRDGVERKIGHIGKTRVVIVSDDVWPCPNHVKLPGSAEQQDKQLSDWHKKWLVINGCSQWQLIRFFLLERMSTLWTSCRWAMLAKATQACCDVGFSYLLVLFIDLVLLRTHNADGEEETRRSGTVNSTAESAEEFVGPDWGIAVGLCLAACSLKFLHGQCYWWFEQTVGYRATRLQLRKWIGAQMLWVDNEQLNLMQTSSSYMSASIQGVESCVSCWVSAYSLGQSALHLFLSVALVVYLVPLAAPLFLVLCILVMLLVWHRSKAQSEMLQTRELAERFWICSLSDLIDNVGMCRESDTASTAQCMYNAAMCKAIDAHCDAGDNHNLTIVFQNNLSAGLLCLLMVGCTLLTSLQLASPGQLVVVITAFLGIASDLNRISSAVMKMVWAVAAMREVSQILSMPNDVHELANQSELERHPGFDQARSQRFQIFSELSGRIGRLGGDGVGSFRQRKGGGTIKLRLQDLVSTLGLRSAGTQKTVESRARVGLWRPELRQSICEDVAEAEHFISLHASDEGQSQAFLSVDVDLGGITLVKGLVDEESENLLRMLAGLLPLRSRAGKLQPTLPFFRYMYVAQIPQLVEGSILMNLLLSVDASSNPSDRDAWLLARLCGLDNKYRYILSSFNVGKGGCHLAVHDRQAICLARAFLADPDVLLLHKPLDNTKTDKREQVWKLIQSFVRDKGLEGMLGVLRGTEREPELRARTVVLTMRDADAVRHSGALCVLDLSEQSVRRQKRKAPPKRKRRQQQQAERAAPAPAQLDDRQDGPGSGGGAGPASGPLPAGGLKAGGSSRLPWRQAQAHASRSQFLQNGSPNSLSFWSSSDKLASGFGTSWASLFGRRPSSEGAEGSSLLARMVPAALRWAPRSGSSRRTADHAPLSASVSQQSSSEDVLQFHRSFEDHADLMEATVGYSCTGMGAGVGALSHDSSFVAGAGVTLEHHPTEHRPSFLARTQPTSAAARAPSLRPLAFSASAIKRKFRSMHGSRSRLLAAGEEEAQAAAMGAGRMEEEESSGEDLDLAVCEEDDEAIEGLQEEEDDDDDDEQGNRITLFTEPEGHVPSFEAGYGGNRGGASFLGSLRGFRRVSDVRTLLQAGMTSADAGRATPRGSFRSPKTSSPAGSFRASFRQSRLGLLRPFSRVRSSVDVASASAARRTGSLRIGTLLSPFARVKSFATTTAPSPSTAESGAASGVPGAAPSGAGRTPAYRRRSSIEQQAHCSGRLEAAEAKQVQQQQQLAMSVGAGGGGGWSAGQHGSVHARACGHTAAAPPHAAQLPPPHNLPYRRRTSTTTSVPNGVTAGGMRGRETVGTAGAETRGWEARGTAAAGAGGSGASPLLPPAHQASLLSASQAPPAPSHCSTSRPSFVPLSRNRSPAAPPAARWEGAEAEQLPAFGAPAAVVSALEGLATSQHASDVGGYQPTHRHSFHPLPRPLSDSASESSYPEPHLSRSAAVLSLDAQAGDTRIALDRSPGGSEVVDQTEAQLGGSATSCVVSVTPGSARGLRLLPPP